MVSLSTKNGPSSDGPSFIVVSEERAGQRLDNFLFTHLKGVPKTFIYRIIRTGQVRVNKGRIKPDYRLKPGDEIRIPPIRLAEKESPIIQKKNIHWLSEHFLYEDDYLIVLNKPSQIAVHGGSGLSFGIIEGLRNLKPSYAHIELIHRLDKETSGCLMLAKRRSALRGIHALFQKGEVQKFYLALVKGAIPNRTVEVPLKKNQLQSGERVVRVSEAGKPSKTTFTRLQLFDVPDIGKISLVKAEPLTGRTHQIRVHAQHLGCPILGDSKYGDEVYNNALKSMGLNRLFLHAHEIRLQLPWAEKILSIQAPLDKPLQALLTHLEAFQI